MKIRIRDRQITTANLMGPFWRMNHPARLQRRFRVSDRNGARFPSRHSDGECSQTDRNRSWRRFGSHDATALYAASHSTFSIVVYYLVLAVAAAIVLQRETRDESLSS
jgi:hypothetical protein